MRRPRLSLVLVSSVFLVSCGDDGTPTDASGPNDVSQADVVRDAPDDVATDAPVDTTTDGLSDAGRIDPGFIDPTTLNLEDDPDGLWLRGDLHVHATGASNDTGGDSTPEDIKRVAMERGLFFVVLTDHSNSTGSDVTTTEENPDLFNMGPEFPYWDRAAELSEEGVFLMIDGNEISPVAVGDPPTTPSGHIGCIPADLDTFDRSGAFIDRPRGAVSGTDALDQALARGCYTVINHPYAFAPWIAFDWSVGGPEWEYDALEVWNGTIGFAMDDALAYDLWRCDLLAGRNVAAIASSDNHRVNTAPPGRLLDPALGYPSTEVFAREATWPGIVEGLQAGRTRLTEGDSRIQLDGYAEGGARATGADLRIVRIRATLDAVVESASLRLTRANSCVDARPANDPPQIDDMVVLEYEVRSGETLDVAFMLEEAPPGVYVATLVPEGEHYSAYSTPLIVPN